MASPPPHTEYRTIIAVDIEGFGRPDRNDPVQRRLRQHLDRLRERLLQRVKATPDQHVHTTAGDEFILSLAPGIPKPKLLEAVQWLAGHLHRDNQKRKPADHIRLRVAMHAGDVLWDPDPLQGETIVFASRLLNSPVLRDCLKATNQSAAIIVSEHIYDNVVKQERLQVATRDHYYPVMVDLKETHKLAWIHVPGDVEVPHRIGAVTPLPDVPVTPPTSITPSDEQVPRQLPANTRPFVGRQEELDRVCQLLSWSGEQMNEGVVVVVHGAAGVGKSALAVRVAHQLADRFPDGQLYVDLNGADPTLSTPLDPQAVLQQFLHSLEPEQRPVQSGTGQQPSPHATAARLRSVLAGRRVLLLLDNARNARQVRPLLPGSGTCAVLITSRNVLSDLDGAEHVGLGLLPPRTSVDLLRRLAGAERIAAEPEAAERIVEHCGRLPLALRIAGARLLSHPASPVQALAGRLEDEHRRIDELEAGDRAVHASFLVSYRALQDEPAGPQAAQLFRLLGLLPTASVSTQVAAALSGRPLPATEAVLRRLADEHLIEPLEADRYQIHDLLRLFARAQLSTDERPQEQDAASLRVLQYCLASTRDAVAHLRPGEPPGAQLPASGQFKTIDAALSWLDAEREYLIATVEQGAAGTPAMARLAIMLALLLVEYLEMRGYWNDLERVTWLALQAAGEQNDRRLEGDTWNARGRLAFRQRDLHNAVIGYHRSLTLRDALGDRDGAASCHNNLGLVYNEQARYQDARESYLKSLAIYREDGRQLREGQTLHNLGNTFFRQGDYEEARRYQEQALPICRIHNDHVSVANVLHGLGKAHLALRAYEPALASFLEEEQSWRDLGDDYGVATALQELGKVQHALGQHNQAAGCWQEAVQLFEQLGFSHDAEAVHALLRDLLDDA